MIEIGKYASLEVVKLVDFGLYLDGGPFGEILLPLRYMPKDAEPGQELEVFIYCDSEDRVIATTEKPYATVGEFALLEVNGRSEYGAFLDWGLSKDLFVPFREQKYDMHLGEKHLVRIYLDERTDRIVASSKLNKFVGKRKGNSEDKFDDEYDDEFDEFDEEYDNDTEEQFAEEGEGNSEENAERAFQVGDKVELIIAEETDLGFKAIINEKHWGVLYHNEIFRDLEIGERTDGYIKNIREDEKVDLSLQQQGYLQQIPVVAQQVLEKLKANDGFLPLTDKSAPEAIYETFAMSKKNFKKAIGKLYKERLIQLEKEGIRLSPDA